MQKWPSHASFRLQSMLFDNGEWLSAAVPAFKMMSVAERWYAMNRHVPHEREAHSQRRCSI